jgi:hypothetical protein
MEPEADRSPHLGPRSRIRGAIPSLPQYAFMAWCSVKAQGKLYLYLDDDDDDDFRQSYLSVDVMK